MPGYKPGDALAGVIKYSEPAGTKPEPVLFVSYAVPVGAAAAVQPHHSGLKCNSQGGY